MKEGKIALILLAVHYYLFGAPHFSCGKEKKNKLILMEEWGTIDTADFMTICDNIAVVLQTKNGYDDILQASTSPSEIANFFFL